MQQLVGSYALYGYLVLQRLPVHPLQIDVDLELGGHLSQDAHPLGVMQQEARDAGLIDGDDLGVRGGHQVGQKLGCGLTHDGVSLDLSINIPKNNPITIPPLTPHLIQTRTLSPHKITWRHSTINYSTK